MLYNTDPTLWENDKRPLKVMDATAFCPQYDALARFRDDQHAREVLTKAGYKETAPNYYTK